MVLPSTATCPHVLLHTLDINKLGLPKIQKNYTYMPNTIAVITHTWVLWWHVAEYSSIVGPLWISLCSGAQPCKVVEWISVSDAQKNSGTSWESSLKTHSDSPHETKLTQTHFTRLSSLRLTPW